MGPLCSEPGKAADRSFKTPTVGIWNWNKFGGGGAVDYWLASPKWLGRGEKIWPTPGQKPWHPSLWSMNQTLSGKWKRNGLGGCSHFFELLRKIPMDVRTFKRKRIWSLGNHVSFYLLNFLVQKVRNLSDLLLANGKFSRSLAKRTFSLSNETLKKKHRS